MPVLRRLIGFWRNLFNKSRVERDLDEEIRGFQNMLAEEKIASGINPQDARRFAAIDSGGIEQVKEHVREVRMGFLLESVMRDVRFAVRLLFKQPGFSLTVLALLALGIAGTTAIFSVFNGLYLRPLPFEEQHRLVNLDETAPQWNLVRTGMAYRDFHAWRQQNKSFESMAVFRNSPSQLSDESRADAVPSAQTTYDLAAVLRIKPAMGRWFLPEEDTPNGPRVVVLGHGIWQSRFGGRSDILGQTLRINAQPYTIVGVMPVGFDFPNRTELWVPIAMNPTEFSGWGPNGIGRLKPGITIAQAREDLLRIHKGLIPTYDVNKITSPSVYTLREWYVGTFQEATSILLAAVGLVLLIACANIAGIMLARGATRMREMGIRAALGAPRGRVIRQLLTESLMLGATGGILGTILGLWALQGLLSLMPPNQLPGWVRFDLDWRFLAFCLVVSIGSAAICGLWPAWSISRTDARTALQETATRSSDSAGRRRSLKALITVEVALAAVLLTAGGLLVQAFRKVEQVNPGFRGDRILTYRMGLPGAKYQKPEQRVAFFDELVAKHRALPGVQGAAVVTATPLGGHWGNFFEVEGAPPRRADDPDPVVLQRVASAGYLEAMGMTLRAGRTFTDADGRSDGSLAAIVNETLAKRFWPGQDAVGKRIRYRGGDNRRWWSVVGVIADVKDYGLDQEPRPSVFVPYPQAAQGAMTVVLRTALQDTSGITSAAREVLRRMDPDLAMTDILTMSERMNRSMWVRRTYSLLVVVFAGLAVVLVVSGLYGVISYSVSQRKREIAIRIALGAGQNTILTSIIKEALLLVCVGLAIGVGCGWWASRMFESLLFGVSRTDPTTYLAPFAILAGVALLASVIPAARAARMQPIAALRIE
jgi:predicted permease